MKIPTSRGSRLVFERWWLIVGLLCSLASLPVRADVIVNVGGLSYDTFIPAGNDSPGVFAFDLSNLTGGFSLPPDFPVVGPLTFQAGVLTLTSSDLSQEVFTLGDIGPGFLLDSDGNPIVQVSGALSFVSAEFTATLSPMTFMLSDGTSFTAGSSSMDVLLLPSSGPTLTVDVDQTTIIVAGAAQTSVPEPLTGGLVLVGLIGLGWRFTRRGVSCRRSRTC